MKQVVKIIRKVDFEKQYIRGLHLEMDYELATLHDAIELNDIKQITKSKVRLAEIHMELKAFNVFA